MSAPWGGYQRGWTKTNTRQQHKERKDEIDRKILPWAMMTALAPNTSDAIDRMIDQMTPPDTSVDRKNRKAYARYLSKVREVEIAAGETETGKPHRSRKRSRSGRRKKR